VLVGLPQGVGGLAILFYFICYNTHQVLIGLPQGDGGLDLLFDLFVCISFYFILVYFYNTHQVRVELSP
jgi:hypothetical protein